MNLGPPLMKNEIVDALLSLSILYKSVTCVAVNVGRDLSTPNLVKTRHKYGISKWTLAIVSYVNISYLIYEKTMRYCSVVSFLKQKEIDLSFTEVVLRYIRDFYSLSFDSKLIVSEPLTATAKIFILLILSLLIAFYNACIFSYKFELSFS